MQYRIVTEQTYQQLLRCAAAIARHLDNRGEEIATELKDIAEEAWNLDHDLNSGWFPEQVLPPQLPVGTSAIVSSQASKDAPDAITLALAVKAYPGVVVTLPDKLPHTGYVLWSLVDAYAVTEGCEDYKGQWVLKRHRENGDGSYFWGYCVSYSELMKRKQDLTIIR
jgi:hypothetical protein